MGHVEGKRDERQEKGQTERRDGCEWIGTYRREREGKAG